MVVKKNISGLEKEKKELIIKEEFIFSRDNIEDEVIKLMMKNSINWKDIIFSIAKEMDIWDIDLTKLTKKFLKIIRKLKELDFRFSGKIILAAAFLLKLKSDKLIDKELKEFDEIINNSEEDNLVIDNFLEPIVNQVKPVLKIKTPQPRKRKISIYDLVEALERVIEQQKPVIKRKKPTYKKVSIPDNKVDVSELIKDLYLRINNHFKQSNKKLTFNDLVSGDYKEDKVLTFIPLLHLENDNAIELLQEEHFGIIEIDLLKKDIPPENLVIDKSIVTH